MGRGRKGEIDIDVKLQYKRIDIAIIYRFQFRGWKYLGFGEYVRPFCQAFITH